MVSRGSSSSTDCCARFVIIRQRVPNRSALTVSFCLAPSQHSTTSVRELPPNALCSTIVIFESRYGMWALWPEQASTTLFIANTDLLMDCDSRSVRPSVWVSLWRSQPARSTRYTEARVSLVSWRTATRRITMQWLLELVTFTPVTAVCRWATAWRTVLSKAPASVTVRSEAPWSPSPRTRTYTFAGSSKS